MDDDDEDAYEMTEEERIELEHDKKNIVFEVLAKGDEENYPVRDRFRGYGNV